MIWSEFGRRPADNDSSGTDHGAGGLLLRSATALMAASAASSPGSRDLDDDENLLVTTDFRSVYATLLQDWLGVEAGRVLPKVPGSSHLPLLRPA